LTDFDLQCAHVPSHAIATAGDALGLQSGSQARAAIDFAVGDKESAESFSQAPILLGSGAGPASAPGVIGTAGHCQHQAKVSNRIMVLLGHELDQGIPLGGRSDSMPMAFFRISWWSLSFWFSLRRCCSSCCIFKGGRLSVSAGCSASSIKYSSFHR
jgi:hypothetical protein